MKRFALFVAIAVGVAAAWQVSRSAGDQLPVSGADSDPLGPSGDRVDTSGAVDAIRGFMASLLEPVKDTAVTISRTIFGTPYDDLIYSSAEQYGIPPQVLYKLLYEESRFRPDIIDGRKKSSTGALGIAQFMPATAIQELGSVAAALNPNQAIPGAARYLAKLRASLGGDLTKAVAAYNWGIGNVKKKGLTASPKETVNYVLSILGVDVNA